MRIDNLQELGKVLDNIEAKAKKAGTEIAGAMALHDTALALQSVLEGVSTAAQQASTNLRAVFESPLGDKPYESPLGPNPYQSPLAAPKDDF